MLCHDGVHHAHDGACRAVMISALPLWWMSCYLCVCHAVVAGVMLLLCVFAIMGHVIMPVTVREHETVLQKQTLVSGGE